MLGLAARQTAVQQKSKPVVQLRREEYRMYVAGRKLSSESRLTGVLKDQGMVRLLADCRC